MPETSSGSWNARPFKVAALGLHVASTLEPFAAIRPDPSLWQGPAHVACQHVAFPGEAARRSGLEGGRPVYQM